MNLKLCKLLIVLVLLLAACQPASPAPVAPETPAAPEIAVEVSPTAPPTPTVEAQPAATDMPAPDPEPAPPAAAVTQPDGSLILLPAAQYGGTITSFAVQDDLLYLTHGPKLMTYNIADRKQPQLIGEPFPLNVVGTGLAVQNNILYMIDREERLYLFHAVDPENMYVDRAFEGAGSSRLFVYGNWGFASSDTCLDGNCTSELKLFSLPGLADVQPVFEEGAVGPDMPIAARLETPGAIVNIFSDESYVYISHQHGVLVANLPDLQIVGQIESQRADHSAYRLPYIYQVGWGFLQTFDVSDPASPVLVLPYNLDDHPQVGAAAAIAGETLYGYESMGEFGHCWSQLYAVDLWNPSQPDAVALSDGKPDLSCVSELRGYQDLLLALDWNGLHLIDVSEAAFPTLVSSIDNQPGTVEILSGGFGFGRSGTGLDTLMVHDFRSLDDIQSFGPFSPGWIMRLTQKGSHLFIPAWEDGLHVVDISDPTFPISAHHVFSQEMQGPGLDSALSGDWLFVARAERGIAVFDSSSPTEPTFVGEFEPERSDDRWSRTSRVAAGDGYLVALDENWQDNWMVGTLNIFDLAGAPELELIYQLDIEQPFLHSALQASGRYAYFMYSGCQANDCGHQILIIDLETPTQPQIMSKLKMPGEAFDLTLHDNYLFLAAGSEGVYAWNIADPAQPLLAAHASTPGWVTRVAMEGDLLVVSDREGGLVIYKVLQ
jgi:hypothetical protein